MLSVESLQSGYGDKVVLRDVSLQVQERELVSLIGSNGVGKTTLLKTLSGLVPVQKGKIALSGLPISGLPPYRISHMGISQVPEGRQVFATLSTLDNLLLGGYPRRRQRIRGEMEEDLESMFALFPRLKERQKQRAGTLSGGEQQMLAIGRALMSHPKLLLLDEPSLGLAPYLVEEIFEIVVRLVRERGISILLVEQNARAALSISSRAYVLESGRIILSGEAGHLLENPQVRKAYLGAEVFET